MQGCIIMQLQQTMQEYVSDTVPISTLLSASLIRLGSELADIKKKRAALAASLKNHKSDVSRSLQSGHCL